MTRDEFDEIMETEVRLRDWNISSLLIRLEKLRYEVWLEDVPNPTTPEYREFHEKIQRILGKIDAILDEMEGDQ